MTTTFSLRDELGLATKEEANPQKKRFETYGVLENPFPPANKTAGNPRRPLPIDGEITNHIKAFLQSQVSEVVVVTGTQGLGKTNLLEFYQRELSTILQDDDKNYFVYYYTDPQPEFGSVVNRIFQELGEAFLKRLAYATQSLSDDQKAAALKLVRTPDLQVAFKNLFLFRTEETKLGELAKLLLEYLMGSRLYKKHTELNLQQRLDTTESKTQALRDVVYLGHHLKVFDGLIIFLDELEKAGSFTGQRTIAYLSAIRALIDALPSHLFLMLAMTPDAHKRYSRDLPALGGRLQDVLELQPLVNEDEAVQLYNFYLEQAREEAMKNVPVEWPSAGKETLVKEEIVRQIFTATLEESRQRGLRGGITPRDFLNALHDRARRALHNLA